MQTFYIKNQKEIKKVQKELEARLNLKITAKNKMISIEGEPLAEYEAGLVMDALNFGFEAKESLLLVSEEYSLKQIHIKENTKRKNLRDVRARIIGTRGKTKKTIESLGDCHINITDSFVYLIAPTEKIEYISTAITSLIKGSKQSNVYKFLENMNTKEKINLNEDLGLKSKE